MKKVILVFALASFVVSCQKIKQGDNKGILQMEEGADRYTEDVQGSHTETHTATVAEDTETPQDSLRTADVKEVTITADSTKTVVK